ncbi:MAG: hypothetical protein COT71_03000 [Candidatus Andersenbacteria bacterium CG10_big_fil_rev_8_21_14_0_10_54_11]|uniref:Membrane protein 6-pyruvoyl-tetrahydropterin synthase-related domain-containing protein n=1 Tax=Candidatus Andersenbacteria bacterium CG10_big_fil_rev_8_21_14_0_10_54_11 TaxID=1974485 RepID=A0A2M6WZ10_9BACT|nr:MAG: hypothetical protein COT71_03000 [Candidatus Andersenbacteria bacterium CG10_big_fil_rev_8_21_14_0_10_54_11]
MITDQKEWYRTVMVPSAAIAVVLVAGAVIASALRPRRAFAFASGALILAAPLVLIGFWYSPGDLGISDWDYYFSYHHFIRTSLVQHHAFPFWNPYTCGGTAGLADPEFPLFTPTFLLELLFGIPTGFRLAIFLSVEFTALGFLVLGKRLKMSAPAALLAALVVTFGSVNLLEIVEGHPNIFAVMWLPWVLWAWLHAYGYVKNSEYASRSQHKAQHKKHTKPNRISSWSASWRLCLGRLKHSQQFAENINQWSIICGIFLALMFFQGGIYLLMYTAAAFFTLLLLVPRRRAALAVTVNASLWALALAAVKLIPVMLWLRQFQDTAYASSAYTLPYMPQILLGRILHGADEIIPNQGSGWHEYGAYIGIPALILAIIGLSSGVRQSASPDKRRSIFILAVGTLAALLLSSAGPLLKPIFDAVPYIPRSNISRIILFAIIPISLLAGMGLDTLQQLLTMSHRTFLNWITRLWMPRQKHRDAPFPRRGVPQKNPLPTGRVAIIIITALSAIIATDLFTLANALSYQAFVLPDVYPPPPPAPAPLAYSAFTYKTRYRGDDYSRSYTAARAGYGTLSYCSVLTPEPAVRTIHDEEDNGLISVKSKSGTFELLSWSPNTVIARITATDSTDILLNTNYTKGWSVAASPPTNEKSWHPAREIAGRVAANVPAGQHTITFRYRTPGFIPGLIISLSALLFISATGVRTATDVIKRRRAVTDDAPENVIL